MHKHPLTLDALRPAHSTPSSEAPAAPMLRDLMPSPADTHRRAPDDADPADNHSPEWMATIGRLGGQSRSAAKSKAARLNGLKGGRPRKREEFVPGDPANVLVHITAGSTLVTHLTAQARASAAAAAATSSSASASVSVSAVAPASATSPPPTPHPSDR